MRSPTSVTSPCPTTDVAGGSLLDMTEHPAPPTTGVEDVDAALAGVAGLEEKPIGAHTAVFEDAHAALRRTLDDPPADA